jgi:exo-beta-1,3-glucanase (GH17 family)
MTQIKYMLHFYTCNCCAHWDSNDVQTFRAAVEKYGASRYAGLTVGNEVQDSAEEIMAKVYDVRGELPMSSRRASASQMGTGYLNSLGIFVPVSTVHTWYVSIHYLLNQILILSREFHRISPPLSAFLKLITGFMQRDNPSMCGADFVSANA